MARRRPASSQASESVHRLYHAAIHIIAAGSSDGNTKSQPASVRCPCNGLAGCTMISISVVVFASTLILDVAVHVAQGRHIPELVGKPIVRLPSPDEPSKPSFVVGISYRRRAPRVDNT